MDKTLIKNIWNKANAHNTDDKGKYQKRAEFKMLYFAYDYVKPSQKIKIVKTLSNGLADRYWFDADDGLSNLLLALYKYFYPTDKKHIQHFQKLIDHYYTNFKTNPRKQDVFMQPEIVNMLYNSTVAKVASYLWLHAFRQTKPKFGFEVHSGVHFELVTAKKLSYLLHGTVLNDNLMHLPSYKGYPKQALTKAQWMKRWYHVAPDASSLWD